MNYSLCKLKFTTPLHAGTGESAKSLDGSEMTFCADTIFSALCHAAETDGGATAVEELCLRAKNGSMTISDMMPYNSDVLYVPRPSLAPKTFRDTGSSDRKLMKSIKYIPISDLPDYISYCCGEGKFTPSEIFKEFGVEDICEKVSLKGLEVSSPYSVGTFSFYDGCGLWMLLAEESEEKLNMLHRLLTLLGCGGIGGKVSSGYGKFELAEDPYTFDATTEEDGQTRLLQRMLTEEFPLYVSLTTSLPSDKELDSALDGAWYIVRRRGGFVQSDTFGASAKKKTQFFLAAGSLFRTKYAGSLYNVAHGGNHEVFRYSKPLFLGVDFQ